MLLMFPSLHKTVFSTNEWRIKIILLKFPPFHHCQSSIISVPWWRSRDWFLQESSSLLLCRFDQTLDLVILLLVILHIGATFWSEARPLDHLGRSPVGRLRHCCRPPSTRSSWLCSAANEGGDQGGLLLLLLRQL